MYALCLHGALPMRLLDWISKSSYTHLEDSHEKLYIIILLSVVGICTILLCSGISTSLALICVHRGPRGSLPVRGILYHYCL